MLKLLGPTTIYCLLGSLFIESLGSKYNLAWALGLVVTGFLVFVLSAAWMEKEKGPY